MSSVQVLPGFHTQDYFKGSAALGGKDDNKGNASCRRVCCGSCLLVVEVEGGCSNPLQPTGLTARYRGLLLSAFSWGWPWGLGAMLFCQSEPLRLQAYVNFLGPSLLLLPLTPLSVANTGFLILL